MTTTPLERLRAAVADSTPLVPVAAGLGLVIDSVDEGRMVVRLPTLPPAVLRGPGPTLPMLDMVLSAVVTTVLPTDLAISTLTMHWAGAGPFPATSTGPMVATGEVVQVSQDSALSTARLVDGDGAIIATVTNRSALLPRPGGVWRQSAPSGAGQPAPGGFEVLELTGGPTGWSVLGAGSLSNTTGAVQGGVVAAVAAHALDELIGATAPHLAGATLDLDLTYLRPVPADGSRFSVTAEPVRIGGRLAAARAEVRDSTGRLAVVASAAQWNGAGAAGHT